MNEEHLLRGGVTVNMQRMDAVVAKPIVLEELLGAIETVLESLEDRDEAARSSRTA